MNLLALEQSAGQAGVAWFRDNTCLEQMAWGNSPEERQRLPATLDRFCRTHHLSLQDVDIFVVDVGPGSFAGIRSALALAIGMALPDRRPVLGLAAPDVMAWPWLEPSRSRRITVVGDARRQQLWAATIEGTQRHSCLTRGPGLIPIDTLGQAVSDADTLLSPDWQRLAPWLAALHRDPASGPGAETHPSAQHLGALACARLAAGATLLPPVPLYLHPAVFIEPRFASAPPPEAIPV